MAEFVCGGCKTKFGSEAILDEVVGDNARVGTDLLGFAGGRGTVGSSCWYSASSLLISDASSLFAVEIDVVVSSTGGLVAGKETSFIAASARRSPTGANCCARPTGAGWRC